MEKEFGCNVKEEGRRLQRNKNGKTRHRVGEVDVAERRRGNR